MTKETKESIADDILLLLKPSDILKKHSISRTTFYRLRNNDKEFKSILREKRAAAWENTIDCAYALAEESMQMIMNTMRDKEIPAKVRMEAATKILNLAKEHNEEVELITRIEDIQDQIEKGWD